MRTIPRKSNPTPDSPRESRIPRTTTLKALAKKEADWPAMYNKNATVRKAFNAALDDIGLLVQFERISLPTDPQSVCEKQGFPYK